jgi:hypothetical protein
MRTAALSLYASLLCVSLTALLANAQGDTASKPVTDVIVNGGAQFSNSRDITIDPVNDQFPTIQIRDMSRPNDEMPTVKNPGKPFRFSLPDRGDGEYHLTFQYLDAAGIPQEPLLIRMIVLDRLPPVVEIQTPKDGSTTDQGFVHVQATVFDPEPGDPTKPPFISRRIAVWINGERFWDKQGALIDIPRFDVQEGTNKLSIVAVDEASNRTEAAVQWVVSLDLDKTPPRLSDINLLPDKSGKVILPDDPEVEVLGHLDDPKAIVTASINGSEPMRVNVIADKYIGPTPMFVRRLALNEGENSLVLSAVDGAGNATDYKFTLVRSDRYRCKITSPDLSDSNQHLSFKPRTVEGYVSALRDAGTKNEARVVAVFVNDIPATLEAKDADGNIRFQSSRPVPFVWRGFPGALYIRIKWSDGEEY